MAEIKSTLDLVMQKTRNLNLSNEEKQEQKKNEISGRIHGLLQKFMDQILDADRLKSEYQKLQKEYDLAGKETLVMEICSRIEPGKDNGALLGLLAELAVSDLEGLISILQEFQTVQDTAAGERRKILKKRLAETKFISGSAVVPNLEIDDHWPKEAGRIEAKYNRLLDEEKARILHGMA